MERALKEKLEKVVELVNNTMVDPDIQVDYCIPDSAGSCSSNNDDNTDPYILVKYSEDRYVERKIGLGSNYLEKSPEDIANLTTFFIEQFMEEVDSLKYGAQ